MHQLLTDYKSTDVALNSSAPEVEFPGARGPCVGGEGGGLYFLFHAKIVFTWCDLGPSLLASFKEGGGRTSAQPKGASSCLPRPDVGALGSTQHRHH